MVTDAWAGREIDGRYLVEYVLGEGGMGLVLRAKHKFTGMPVAIKMLRPQLELDEEMQGRFLAEAQAPNAIGHPGIVKVLDAGRSAEGQLYMVMELLVGRSLRVPVGRRELTPDQILRITLDLLGVLGQAHAKGFVHRDLKPDNVFLCAPADEVKLLDFGIAKVLDNVRNARTAAGSVMGTPAYMAPEQLADARSVDARADLWAVGVMLYEMVAGQLPLQGATPPEMLSAVAFGTPTPIRAYLPNASRELEEFFTRALARDPKRRFGAAVELAQALGTLVLPVRGTGPVGAPGGVPSTVGSSATSVAVTGSSTVASAAGHTAPSMHVSPIPLVPSSNGSKKLAVALVLALGAIAILVIVLATRRSSDDKTIADARSADRPRPDAAEVVAVVHDRALCEQECKELMSTCGTRLGTCVSDCLAQPVAFDACFDRSMKDCADGATCGFAAICNGRVPSGTASCRSVSQCQTVCFGSSGGTVPALLDCLCNCDLALDPAHTLELARLNACGNRCGSVESCMRQNCGGYAAQCR